VKLVKIWNSFGSAHSANLTIIGEFKKGTNIDLAERIIRDFVNFDYEKRYENINEFYDAWESECIPIRVLGPNQCDFQIGVEYPGNVDKENEKITVSEIRDCNIGGIIKIMLLYNPIEIKVTGQTGP